MTSSTDTRFIIITHNPITMARMNRLYGVTMAERGVSLLIIQKQLGHASLAATGVYIDHLKPTAVVDAMRAREW